MSDHTKIATIILAAGMGKRMNNPNLPKVLATLNSKPLLGYVLDVSTKIDSQFTVVVVGHKKELVQDFVQSYNNSTIQCVVQVEQLGTGHAAQQAETALATFDKNGLVVILSGDVPLIQAETLTTLLSFHSKNSFQLTLISTILENPKGYGRLVRNENGDFLSIVEEKDASDSEKLITEINSGIYCIEHKYLFSLLERIQNSNAQGEFYLTDLVKIFRQKSLSVGALIHNNSIEISGINTEEERKNLEAIFLKRKND